MKRVLLLLTIPAVMAFGQILAPNPNPGSTPFPQLQAYLALTDAQLQQLLQGQTTYYQGLQTLTAQIADKQKALTDLVASGSQDTNAVGTLYLAITNLQGEFASAAKQYRTQAMSVLTADQRTKVAALDAALKLVVTADQAIALGLLDSGFASPPGIGIGVPVISPVPPSLPAGQPPSAP